jgi:hypothetical protein
MGVASAVLSYPYGSVSTTARVVPFALTAPENGGVNKRVDGELVVVTFGCEGGMGLACSFTGMTLPKEGRPVNEEAAR